MRTSKQLDAAVVHKWLVTAERGDLAALKQQLAAEPRLVDAPGRGPYWTGNARAIHYVAYRGHLKVLRWLLSRGSIPSPVAGEFDWAPLHFAAIPPKRPVFDLLVKHGATPDIFTAAAMSDVREVRRMLRRNPRLVSRRGPDGATALHFSSSRPVARALLNAGANPRARDRYHDSTPTEWTLDRPPVAKIIAEAAGGVDVFIAAAIGDMSTLKALVREHPRLVSKMVVGRRKTFGAAGETALAIAARHGQRQAVEFLLKAGASAASRPSPLAGAVHKGDLAIVRRLLDAGADPNTFGPHGYAALHAACVHGRLRMIRLLLARGARVDLRDREYDATPLGWAEYHHNAKAAALLRGLA